MRKLYEEISVRFPEIRDLIHRGDDELPYVMIGHVAHWVRNLPETGITPEILARIQSFAAWCEDQPAGETAGDDIHTILVVGFYEKLFEAERMHSLLPKLITKTMLVRNADYLRTWVGEDNFRKASKHFS
jgi:hypothetical protein